MADLKAIYTQAASRKMPVFAPHSISAAQAAQMGKLEEVLATISSDDCECGTALNGLDMVIAISNGNSSVMIPFTLQDSHQGSRILVDNSGGAPVAFDMFSDARSFVRFLAAEQKARVLRQNLAVGIVGHTAKFPAKP